MLKMNGGPIHSLTGLLQYIAGDFFTLFCSMRNQAHTMEQSTIDNFHPWFSKPKIITYLKLSTNFPCSCLDYLTTINQKKLKQHFFPSGDFFTLFCSMRNQAHIMQQSTIDNVHPLFSKPKIMTYLKLSTNFLSSCPDYPDYNQPKKNSNNIFSL